VHLFGPKNQPVHEVLFLIDAESNKGGFDHGSIDFVGFILGCTGGDFLVRRRQAARFPVLPLRGDQLKGKGAGKMHCSCSSVDNAARILFTCSGCCSEGEACDIIGRKLRQSGYARCGNSCLAGVGAGYPKFLNAAKAASEVVVIDGCGMRCASAILKKTQIEFKQYVLTEMGFGAEQDVEEFIDSFCNKMLSQ
jgi:uncharacterized metal-binding protein